MIAVIPLVGVLYGAQQSGDALQKIKWYSMIPWFIVGFAMMSALRTLGDAGDRPFGVLDPALWKQSVNFIRSAAEYCLLVAMAAVGLTSMLDGILKIGLRPFVLGLFAAVLIGVVSLALIYAFAESIIALVGL
jgi:uncharacterized membrane protein YadS